jgi:hypothetical protein
LAKLDLNFRECGSWESTASNWCLALHGTLCAHPHLTDLMTDDDVPLLGDYVLGLVKVTVQEGISRDIAAECSSRSFREAVRLILAGVRAEASDRFHVAGGGRPGGSRGSGPARH